MTRARSSVVVVVATFSKPVAEIYRTDPVKGRSKKEALRFATPDQLVESIMEVDR